jgi:hypothetical protein
MKLSITNLPSRACCGSKKSKVPPEQPVPRMFTPMYAYPFGTKRSMYGWSGTEPGLYPEYSKSVGCCRPSFGKTAVYLSVTPSGSRM